MIKAALICVTAAFMMGCKGPVSEQKNTDIKPDSSKIATNYVCPMHPDITSVTEADCSVCGMRLEKVKNTSSQGTDR
jgi:hypothetical protein